MIMNYLVLSLVAKEASAILERERIKASINKLLVIEQVDDRSIFWDEEGDLLFHPPVHKKDKSYWLSVLNSALDRKNWEFVAGKL